MGIATRTDALHRFLSIPLRTSYPPHPEPRITRRCLLLEAEELNMRTLGVTWAGQDVNRTPDRSRLMVRDKEKGE